MQKQVCEFEIKDMLPIGMTLVVLGIGIAYGLSIMGDVKDDFTNSTSPEAVAVGDAITGVSKLTAKLPTIVTVVAAAVLIGILVRYLWVRFA